MSNIKDLIEEVEKTAWKFGEELSNGRCYQCDEKIQNNDSCACYTEEKEVASVQATRQEGNQTYSFLGITKDTIRH